jgi:hypothetical protein
VGLAGSSSVANLSDQGVARGFDGGRRGSLMWNVPERAIDGAWGETRALMGIDADECCLGRLCPSDTEYV